MLLGAVRAACQMVSHMVTYEQQLRQEVLLNIERLQAGQLSEEEEDEEVRPRWGQHRLFVPAGPVISTT